MRSSSNFLNMDAFFIIVQSIPQISRLCHQWVLFYFYRLLSLSVRPIFLPVGNMVYKNGQPVQKGFALPVSLAAIQGAADMPVGGVEKFHSSPSCMVLPVMPAPERSFVFFPRTHRRPGLDEGFTLDQRSNRRHNKCHDEGYNLGKFNVYRQPRPVQKSVPLAELLTVC